MAGAAAGAQQYTRARGEAMGRVEGRHVAARAGSDDALIAAAPAGGGADTGDNRCGRRTASHVDAGHEQRVP